MGVTLIILFLILCIISLPIALALIASAVGAVILSGRYPVEVVFHRMTGGLDSFVLLAIPFFILAGNLMNTSGITKRIFDFANALVGRIPGGLAHANIVASIIFSGMSGSAVADAGGLGLIELKAMHEQGFPDEFSGAVTAASATIGPIIPPSVPMVVYGVMAEVSIGKLFLAGFIPGLLMGVALMILVYYMARKHNYPRSSRFSIKEVATTFKEAFWALLTPVIIIGGILGGIFTPTEAAAAAVIYALFLGFFVYKELTLKDLWHMLLDSFHTTAVVTLIISAAASFAWLIAIDGIPAKIANFLISINMSKIVFLLIFNILFLVLGTFMESLSIIVITVPVLIPVMKALQLDPLHLGVVLVLNLMIGLVTPPVGMSLFVTSKIGNIKLETLYRSILPFIVPLLIVLFLITYLPDTVTWLPSLIMK
jgi:tripartite ATP-independent transporter DctM subunit